MKLLILGDAPSKLKNYRGVDRHTPYYVSEMADNHPINQLFYWSTETSTQGYLSDLEKAEQLVQMYLDLVPSQQFKIIQITRDDEIISDKDWLFLGYDISTYTYSVLSEGMNYCDSNRPTVAHPLICLIEKYFKPQLNKNFLFQDYDVANDCLNCMKSLHQIAPQFQLWEMHDPTYNLTVTGIYEYVAK